MTKTVLITGVSGGIGWASALLFSKMGWTVIGVDRKIPPASQNKIQFVKGDVSDSKSSQQIFKKVSKMTDFLDALINNAAVLNGKPIQALNVNEWDHVIETNLRSMFLSVRNGYDLLRKPQGAIVNVSSVHAVATSAHISAYAASKGAVVSFSRALAVELAPIGIRVNSVLPGAVDTEMLRSGLSRGNLEGKNVDQKIQALSRKTLLGRIGHPREIAEAILFLSDPERSSFITGQSLVVDGGALARLSTE